MSDLVNHDIVANAGDFIILLSKDKKEIRVLDFFSRMMHPIVIDIAGNKLNFAMSRVAGTIEKYQLLVCTYDAKWDNSCRMFPISVLPVQKRIEIGAENSWPMAEGMCAHRMYLSDDFIVLSCSKMFQDGSSRKVRISSATARDGAPGEMRPVLIAE